MPVKSAAVGSATAPHDVEITPRMTMAYAAGIGDANQRFLDDAAEPGVIAPPAFCTALEWPVMLAVRDITALGLSGDEALRGVHASQDSAFHRPIRPGDRLRTVGTIVQIRRIPPGALLVTRFDTVDAGTGGPVVTTYSGSIFRGIEVDGEDRYLEEPPALEPAADEQTLPGAVTVPIAREAGHVYTECAGIWNPIHTERQIARAAGLPDIILHGTALWAIAAREIVNRYADGDPLRLHRLSGRFSAMVVPGSTVALQYGMSDGEPPLVHFTMRNATGDPAISHGVAVFTS